ncbi:MAG: M64 family metallopeptidase [Gammaproteobacteria bacterium]
MSLFNRCLRTTIATGLLGVFCHSAMAGEHQAASDSPTRTMRLDYFHTGNANQEIFAVDKVAIEPLPWPGHPDRAIDTLGLGDYFFEVVDPDSGVVLYSRGFSGIYPEWEEMAEATTEFRTFHESLRFPEPATPVLIRVFRRDAGNRFMNAWETVVDPADIAVDRAPPPAQAPLIVLQQTGAPADKVDLLILGDGYTPAEMGKFEDDARRMMEALFSVSPFRERRDDFNVWAMAPAAARSGVSRPSSGVQRYTVLGTRYDAFGSERYVLTFDNRALREIAAHAPYEFMEILVNNQTYGGGGVHGMYATAAVDSAWADYLFVHEFGHHFAALADEYFTSPVAYQAKSPDVEPWEPNVTALLDADAPKWRSLMPAATSTATPIPTPWPKKAFETYARDFQTRRQQIRAEGRPEAEMNALFEEAQAYFDQLLGDAAYRDQLGAFEGAYYEAEGYYRPAMNCLMFTRHPVFCPVCSGTVSDTIDLYAGPAVTVP